MPPSLTRRQVLAGTLAAASVVPTWAAPLTRPIPSTAEPLPAVGLGTWITFNVGRDPEGRAASVAVMRAFLDGGGRLIDSSPMYGSSQQVVGDGLAALHAGSHVFSADKVWIGEGGRGAAQAEASRRLWRVPRFDLLQVHNLLAWQEHLPMLLEMKAAGRLRYVGITTSEGRRHDELERIMRTQPIDFVQLTYNAVDREPEQRLLPLARERRIAVIANRPFQGGALLRALRTRPLPAWAAEGGAASWAKLLLKFIVAHPDLTCTIPATTQVVHVRENLAAAAGPLPDAALRQRIAALVREA